MSLINDMLRDLEKRRREEDRRFPCAEVPLVVAEATPLPKLLLLGGVVLLLVAIAWAGSMVMPGWLAGGQNPRDIVRPQPVALGTIPVEERQPPAGTGVLTAAVQPVVADSEKAEQPTAPAAQGPTLLGIEMSEDQGSARLHIVFDHLTEYRLLSNELDKTQLIVSFSQGTIASGVRIPPLTGALLKNISLLPGTESLRVLVTMHDNAQVLGVQAGGDSGQTFRLQIEIAGLTPAAEKRIAPVASLPTSKVFEKTPPVKSGAPAKISKNRTLPSPEKTAYQAGLDFLAQGDWAAAEQNFRLALKLRPQLQEARLQLVAVLQKQAKHEAARQALQQALALTPGNPDLRKVYARSLLDDRQPLAASDVLKTAPVPSVTEDLEYHALLAAVLQESGQFAEAAGLYAQLVQIRPRAGLWWMGLGISLEQTGRFDAAREAYQNALQSAGLRPDLHDYINSRLQAL